MAAIPVCPVYLEPAPGMTGAPSPGTPLLPASWSPAGGLSHRGPFGAQVGGRHTVLTKPSSPPRGRNSDVVGFPFGISDIGAPFSLMVSFWPDMSCCLARIPGSLPDSSPGHGLGGAHQHPSFHGLCDLGRAQGPDFPCPPSNPCLPLCGAGGRPWGQSPLGAETLVHSTSPEVLCPLQASGWGRAWESVCAGGNWLPQ